MKGVMAVTVLCTVLACSTATAQELSIGPAGGAMFLAGSRGEGAAMHGTVSSFAFGGEVVYSFSSVPIDLIGQGLYAPAEGHGHYRHDSLAYNRGPYGHEGDGSSLFSFGVGGRWVPLRGPVSPYLGVSLLLSHQESGMFRYDSTGAYGTPPGDPDSSGHHERYGAGGGVTRFGVGLSVGSEFVISSLIRLDVGASYSLNSPFDRGRNLSTIGFGASVLFTLF